MSIIVLIMEGGRGSRHSIPVFAALIEQFHLVNHLKMIKKSI